MNKKITTKEIVVVAMVAAVVGVIYTLLPLLCVAARRGERVACAMESRGLGRTEKRTYYKTTEVTKSDWLFLVIGVIIYIIIVMILVKYDLFKLNFASIK